MSTWALVAWRLIEITALAMMIVLVARWGCRLGHVFASLGTAHVALRNARNWYQAANHVGKLVRQLIYHSLVKHLN